MWEYGHVLKTKAICYRKNEILKISVLQYDSSSGMNVVLCQNQWPFHVMIQIKPSAGSLLDLNPNQPLSLCFLVIHQLIQNAESQTATSAIPLNLNLSHCFLLH